MLTLKSSAGQRNLFRLPINLKSGVSFGFAFVCLVSSVACAPERRCDGEPRFKRSFHVDNHKIRCSFLSRVSPDSGIHSRLKFAFVTVELLR